MFFVTQASTAKYFGAPRSIFWAAFGVRLAYILLAHTYHVRLDQDHFQFGWEMGRIARALVRGYGYADPFIGHTGPTAWVPPLYPLIIAAAFKIFGVYSAKAALALMTLNSIFSAVTAVLVYEIGARCFGVRNALWAGWLWALYPAAAQYAVHWIWEMSLTTMLFSLVLVLALLMRSIGETEVADDAQSLGRWLVFGLLWGLIALSNSTLLLFLPVCAIWILLGAARLDAAWLGRSLLRGLAAAVVCCAVIAPWTMRNQRAFHAFIPLRGNLGAELYMGDGPGSTGYLMEYDHPFQDMHQLELYRSMGEVRYVRMRGDAAKAFIRGHRAHFLAISAKRAYFFWASVPQPFDRHKATEYLRESSFGFISLAGLMGLALALRRHRPAAGLFAWAFALLPLTYYFVTVHARFRHTLEPVICVLGVYLFQSAEKRLPGWLGGWQKLRN
jgi:4-amino-4-deoxy-L-arabinose transferase-like glycosyltransferase